jgi:MFS family permease
VVEGLADAAASFTKMAAGYIADRLGARKALVVLGYGLTPVGQALIALAGGAPLILTGRLVSWFGKGLRGPLRDAIVAEAVTPQTRGRAFGFHRAMDTVGAVVGPLLGVWLLSVAQEIGPDDPASPFRLVFWLTLIPGALSVLAFALLVRDDRTAPNPGLRFFASLRQLSPDFRRYLAAVGVFAAGDYSHTLLILAATELLAPDLGLVGAAQVAGGLYVLRNLTQALASYPVGVLADRAGHRGVLLAGYALGVLTTLLMALAFLMNLASIPVLAAVFVLAGLYMAVQEVIEPSMTASLVPAGWRSLGYGALGTVNGVGKLISSVAVGSLWTAVSPVVGFGAAALLMAAGTAALARVRASEARQ